VPIYDNYCAAGMVHHNCGKTHSGGMELAMHLTGKYPDWWNGKRFDKPIMAWAGSDTGETTRNNPQRALMGTVGNEGTGSIPGEDIISVRPARGVAGLFDFVKVKHVSGGESTLQLKYYEQGRQKWQGPPIDYVWLDEEPPEDIYFEALARTIATRGILAITFTPLLGMTGVVSGFLLTPSAGQHDTNMTIDDALHIHPEERQRIIDQFPAHEREARTKGTPMLGSGRIFPVAESEITIPPLEIPRHWPQIGALDFGWDHPTAAVKLAWDRDGDVVYVTHCYRKREATPQQHAASLRPWGDKLPWAWPHDGYQHDKGSGDALADQYRKEHLQMLDTHATFEDGTNGVEAGLMMMLDRMESGRLKVFSNLNEWFQEYRMYHRKDGKVVKLADDLMSATRYGVMSLRHAKSLKPANRNNHERGGGGWM
jgi:phage terminase large subunit-like protein